MTVCFEMHGLWIDMQHDGVGLTKCKILRKDVMEWK